MLSRLKWLYRLYKKILRYPFKYYNCKRLNNKNFTLIANDCVGALILNELGLRFNTPTINLWFHAGDFVKFCGDMKYYLSQEMTEDRENTIKMGYPVGILGSDERKIRVWLLHYETFSQAKAKWEERSSRVHWDNMFIIMTDGQGCNEEVAREFDSLLYEHKALLTYRNFPGVNSAVKMNVKKLNTHGIGAPDVFAYKSLFSGKRVIDDWDYVSFFNS